MKTYQRFPSTTRAWRPWGHLLAIGVTLLAASGWAWADPPGRAARLGYVSGQVSFSPAGEDDWGQAAINRPLTTGDRLWADAGGRAEIQLGGAMVRMSDSTAVSVLNMDDNVTQLQLTEGSLNVRVRRLEPDEYVEVDTPNLAFTLRRPGAYRIDVDPEGTSTVIRMREGEGEVSSDSGAYLIQAPQVQRFIGDAARDDGYASVLPPDDFDRWAGDRDRAYTTSVSARYVSPDVVGYQDLDEHGNWAPDPSHGHVWYPSRVSVGWAPYRDGHWAWIDPWGWTWVDHAPWGYAVSHYGRWAHIRGRWGWVPGPVRVRATYAPALVAFVGGPGFSLKISVGGGGGGGGGVGWFPLGPREVYRPAYKVSPAYLERVNVSNTVINKTVIKNIHVTNVTNITYVNRRVPGAVVAVSQDTFRSAQPVAKAVIKAPREVIESREVVAAAPIAPNEKSLRAAGEAKAKPPARAFTRQVVAKTEPPPPKASFAAQRERLAARPGQPLDDEERRQLRATPAVAAAASAAAPAVKVVSKKTTTAQTLAPRASKASEAGDVVPAAGPAAASEPPRRRASEPERKKAEQGASAPAARASAPAKATAAERRASAAEARKQREDRKPRARDEAASAAAPAAAASPAARPNRPPRPEAGASAAEGRKPKRAPAGETAPAPRASAEGAEAPAREATKPRTAEERQAKRAEQAAKRASEAEEGRPRKEP